MEERLKQIAKYIGDGVALQRQISETCGAQILHASDSIAACIHSGGKVLLCGNGGSAADCQHVAAELVSCLSRDFSRGALPAIALTTDSSLITAYANDFGFAGIFERQVEALGRAEDILVAISTSGRSENVRKAVKAAKEKGMNTIALTGGDGPLEREVDIAIVIPGKDTQHLQEAMLPVEHLICMLVERSLFGGNPRSTEP